MPTLGYSLANGNFPAYAMSARPYHHGNLREALLAQAEATLRERGLAALSLRELAREIGVSHAAPRRHFPDRQALLDALAKSGFARLGEGLRSAIAGSAERHDEAADGGDLESMDPVQHDGELETQVRALAHAYIAFATDAPDLIDLMFASKHGEGDDTLELAAQSAFAPVLTVILAGQRAGVLPAGDPERVGLGQLAAMHGIASLLTVGVISPGQVDELIDDAVARFLTGASVGDRR
jgi:AcrR family transcriptional regulator